MEWKVWVSIQARGRKVLNLRWIGWNSFCVTGATDLLISEHLHPLYLWLHLDSVKYLKKKIDYWDLADVGATKKYLKKDWCFLADCEAPVMRILPSMAFGLHIFSPAAMQSRQSHKAFHFRWLLVPGTRPTSRGEHMTHVNCFRIVFFQRSPYSIIFIYFVMSTRAPLESVIFHCVYEDSSWAIWPLKPEELAPQAAQWNK